MYERDRKLSLTFHSASIAIVVSTYCKQLRTAKIADNSWITYHEVVDVLPQPLYAILYFNFDIMCVEDANEHILPFESFESFIYFVNRAVISIRNNRRAQRSNDRKVT